MIDDGKHYCELCWCEIRCDDLGLCDDCIRPLAYIAVELAGDGSDLTVDVVEVDRPGV